MSLRNRARRLQEKTGLSYQQALARLRKLGIKPAELAKKTGWTLEVCDRFLIDGHAPIEVVDVEGHPIRAVCERLRVNANARAVLLALEHGPILAHVGPADVDRAVFIRTALTHRAPQRPEGVIALDEGVVLAMEKVKPNAMLVVKFHEGESSLGLVRLRMKQAAEELERLLREGVPGGPPGHTGGGGGPGGAPAEARVAKPKRRRGE